jgi:hypothetical protein
MPRTFLPLLLLVLLCAASPDQSAQARRQATPRPSTGGEQEVLRDFETILDLWRDGRFGELYERTSGGKGGKEGFAKRMAAAPRKPACCWEKIQQARVTMKGEDAATVHARLGLEGGVSSTEFVTKGFKLKRQDTVWQISQADLFALASLSKKRARYKYLPIQPK